MNLIRSARYSFFLVSPPAQVLGPIHVENQFHVGPMKLGALVGSPEFGQQEPPFFGDGPVHLRVFADESAQVG